jgi:hypothetical protein
VPLPPHKIATGMFCIIITILIEILLKVINYNRANLPVIYSGIAFYK